MRLYDKQSEILFEQSFFEVVFTNGLANFILEDPQMVTFLNSADAKKIGVYIPEFVEEEIDNTSVYIATASIGIFILVSVLFAGLVIRRRRRLADIDLIDSWGVFGSESEELEDEELEA